MKEKLSVAGLRHAKVEGRKLSMVTAYDHPSAVIADQSPIDIILVGDSLSNNVLGYEGTGPVTMEEMLHHLRAVTRGAHHTFVVGDLPLGSYHVSPEQAMANAIQYIKAGADCVKLEGGVAFADTVHALVRAGIPVMGHIGLMPQMLAPSAWRVRGKDAASARQILEDASALEQAGACAMVLEAVPASLAARVTGRVSASTFGIGAGPHCDGQVLIWHDLLGLHDFRPRHNKLYANLAAVIGTALGQYHQEVLAGAFPAAEHSYTMRSEELELAMRAVEDDKPLE
jgi:3-methyl-2-oxobutanoate hydroxymethyltransferase